MKLRTIEDIEKDKLEAKLEDSIFLRMIDFGLGYPDGFTYKQIIEGMELEGWEKTIVEKYLDHAHRNTNNAGIPSQSTSLETPFFAIKTNQLQPYNDDSNKYIISFDAHFKFIDYHELKFARENAKEAKHLAVIAIAVSVGAALASIAMPVIVAQIITQTVHIDEAQLKSLQSTSTVQAEFQSNENR
jgi:hypothetical protein